MFAGSAHGALRNETPIASLSLQAGGIVMFLVMRSGRGRDGTTLPRCGWGRLQMNGSKS